MKNYKGQGNTLNWTNGTGSDVSSGAGVLVGKLFGVAAGDIADGEDGVLNLVGEYELPKAASQAWSVGAKVFWDDTNKNCTTTATSNTFIGAATVAIGSGADETTGTVRLNGVAAA